MNRALSCVAAALVALSAAGCGGDGAKKDDHFPSVSAAVVEAVDLQEEIRASGDLNARLHTTIAAEIEGRITEISVDEGGSVKAIAQTPMARARRPPERPISPCMRPAKRPSSTVILL